MIQCYGNISHVLGHERKQIEQAGAELCQAQFNLGLADPTVAGPPPSQLC